jgi:4-hydroxybenzoyl-CoA reductase subunit beta
MEGGRLMLPMPRVAFALPRSLEDALDTLASRGPAARILAGGTDLVPNLKHGLLDVEVLVPLKRVPGLRGVARSEDGSLRIGALTSLSALSSDATLQGSYPVLAQAVGQIAGPQLRNMGTIGGNLCLDTRCTYYNQTEHWRIALGYCLKRTGTTCHVVPGGTRCVAAVSSDSAPVLSALGGALVLRSAARGERVVELDHWFLGEGRKNTVVEPDEILTEVRLPAPAAGAFAGYQKLRPRAAIDFPILAVAVAGTRSGDGALTAARVVVGALGAKPREVSGVSALVAGKAPTRELLDAVGALAFKQCRPLTNIPIDPEWRHEMVPVLVRRAFAQGLGLVSEPALVLA